MLAASGAVAVQAFGKHYSSGVLVMAGLCFAVLLFDVDGLIGINAFIAPFMVVGGIFVGLYAFFTQSSQTFGLRPLFDNWASSAVVYASYNIVTAVSLLTSMGRMAEHKNTARRAGLLGGACMTVSGLSLSLPLFLNCALAEPIEIPILTIIKKYGAFIRSIYLFVLIAAIFTTAVSNAFAAVEWLSERFKLDATLLKAVLPPVCALIAHVGFSNFIGRIYPVFGYLGLTEILFIIMG